MTLNLTADTEARVRSFAELRGQDPEEALIALLNQALAEAESETQEETLAALRASVEDYAAGRWISLEDYEAQIQAKRQARHAGKAHE